MTVDDKIAEKIRLLLRLGEHPATNENEAASALAKAQELLIKYGLDRADINLDGQVRTDEHKISSRDLILIPREVFNNKWPILSSIAKFNMGTTVGHMAQTQFGYIKVVELIAKEFQQEAITQMYRWVEEQLDRRAQWAWEFYLSDCDEENVPKRERQKEWYFKAGFYDGASVVIHRRLREGQEEAKKNITNATALILFEDKAVEQFLKAKYPNLGHSYARAGSAEGAKWGAQAGEKVNFNNPGRIERSGGRLLT